MEKREPSDIINLLGELAQKHGDSTCHSLRDWAAHHHEPILNICYEAILILTEEKARITKMACDLAALRPMPPLLMSKEQAEKWTPLPPPPSQGEGAK